MFNIFKKKDNNIIESTTINNLQYNKEYNQYTGTSYINKFNKECNITIESNDIEYAEKCIKFINNEESNTIFEAIYESLVLYCKSYLEEYNDINIPKDISGKDILNYLSEETICIFDNKDNKIGFNITGNCTWEEEHGFIIVVNDEKVKYVGEHGNLYYPWEDLSQESHNFATNNKENKGESNV